MTGPSLAEVLCVPGHRSLIAHGYMIPCRIVRYEEVPCQWCAKRAAAVTAHLAAILADPETVEAVAERMAMAVVTPRGRRQARRAIGVIAERLGVGVMSDLSGWTFEGHYFGTNVARGGAR